MTTVSIPVFDKKNHTVRETILERFPLILLSMHFRESKIYSIEILCFVTFVLFVRIVNVRFQRYEKGPQNS